MEYKKEMEKSKIERLEELRELGETSYYKRSEEIALKIADIGYKNGIEILNSKIDRLRLEPKLIQEASKEQEKSYMKGIFELRRLENYSIGERENDSESLRFSSDFDPEFPIEIIGNWIMDRSFVRMGERRGIIYSIHWAAWKTNDKSIGIQERLNESDRSFLETIKLKQGLERNILEYKVSKKFLDELKIDLKNLKVFK